MKRLLVLAACVVFFGCDVRPSKLKQSSVDNFASKVKCSVGYKGKCWCFVASRKVGDQDSTGIGMTLAPDELCN